MKKLGLFGTLLTVYSMIPSLLSAQVDTVWVRRYNGPDNYDDYAIAIAVDNANNVYVTGYSYGSVTYVDYVTIKYYPNGDTAWVRRYNGPSNYEDYASAIAVDNANNVYVTGYSDGYGTYADYATIKYVQTPGIEERDYNIAKQGIITKTIFNDPLLLPKDKNCKVFDITGRVVAPDKIKPGIYFIEVDGLVIQKVVKVK